MATKKLQKLVNDPATSDEDKVAIQAIIDKRQAVSTPPADDAALSPEEQAAINAAEQEAAKQNSEAGESNDAKPKAKREAKPKQSMEELDAEVAKANEEALGHRCEALMPGTAIKISGYVKGVLKEKRAMRCYLLIQSDVTDENPTGRQFYKVFKEVTILPETVELHKAKKTGARRKAQVDTEEWMAQADEIVEAAGSYVGRQIDLGDDTKTDSRIETIIKDKRSCTVFFRIGFKDENGAHKFTHKAIHSTKDEAEGGKVVITEPEGLLPLDDADETYKEFQTKWQTRAERQPRTALTPEEKVIRAEEALNKAKKALEKAQEALQNKQLEYDNAKAALDAKHDEQEANAEAEAKEAVDAAAAEAESGDLM
ncbi:hypothetical protein [uncultured Megamonas sp.]|uniref:hypothetical protein n=1 Tax=uncultured Megamonas sp. TaxID=286140 RepID=UPI002594EB8A|nr:hypothetical protein [uncultured Megamonas sp.]